jgi:hypothetical protein
MVPLIQHLKKTRVRRWVSKSCTNAADVGLSVTTLKKWRWTRR